MVIEKLKKFLENDESERDYFFVTVSATDLQETTAQKGLIWNWATHFLELIN